jgi:uncharacterized membrane protein YdjX (TVP38/TMEM64 family)
VIVTRHILQGLVMIAIMALLAWLLGDLLDRHWIDVYVRGHGVAGELLFVGVAALLLGIGLSRQVVAFMAGYGFGFAGGFLLSMVAVVAGCMITFYCTRFLLRGALAQHFSKRARKLDMFLHDHTFTATLLLRLLPVGSNWMVNIAAGVSAVRGVPFLLGSMLGFIPQMLIFALVGSGSQLQQFWQVVVAMAMFVVSALLGIWLFARYRRHYRVEQQSDMDAQDAGLVHKS